MPVVLAIMAQITDGFAEKPADKEDQKKVEERKGQDKDTADELKLQGKNPKTKEERADEDGLENHPGFLPEPGPSPELIESKEIKYEDPEGKDEPEKVQVPGKREENDLVNLLEGFSKGIGA
jgi:hypothetical protein